MSLLVDRRGKERAGWGRHGFCLRQKNVRFNPCGTAEEKNCVETVDYGIDHSRHPGSLGQGFIQTAIEGAVYDSATRVQHGDT